MNIPNQEFQILDLEVERKSAELGVTMGVATDMPLRIGDRLFHAHRSVLSLYSPVIKAMTSEQWSQTNGDTFRLSDEHIDVDVMDDLLAFLYTGRITLTADNAHPLFVTTNFLGITTLFADTAEYLCKLINTENVLQLSVFSSTLQLENLFNSCLLFIKANYVEVFQDPRILELPNFKDIVVGLKEQVWGTNLRKDTFHLIIRWAEKDLSERSTDLPALLKNIPLEELPFDFLTDTVSTHPLVKDSPSCMETLSGGIENYQSHSDTTSKTQQNFIVIGLKRDKQIIECYDWQTHILTELPPMIEFHYREFACTVVDRNRIVVAGGADLNWKLTDFVSVFDWSTQTWSELTRMPFPRSGCSMVFLNDSLYVTGGRTDSDYFTRTVQCYSFTTQQWSTLKEMIYERIEGKLVEHKGFLYAIGGWCEGDFQNTVERYDPVKDEWTEMASMHNKPNSLVAAVHEDMIYAWSDYSFQVYDPETNVWTDLGKTYIKHMKPLLSMNGQLVAVGAFGYGIGDAGKHVWRFDTTTQQWTPLFEVDQCLKYIEPYRPCPAVVGAFY